MRKLDAAVDVVPYGEGGARLTLKTPSGEGFIVDLAPAAVPAVRDAFAGIVSPVVDPPPDVAKPKPAKAART
jgi:hypothetical protein